MSKFTGYERFQIGFHVFIALIALVIAISYTLYSFQIAYVIIASIIAISNIYYLYKLFKNTPSDNPN